MAMSSGGKFLKFVAKNSTCCCLTYSVWVFVRLYVTLRFSVCVFVMVCVCVFVWVHLKRSSGKWWLLGGGTSVAILMVTTVSTSIPPSFASPKSTLVSSHYIVSIFESKFNEIKVSVFRGEIYIYWLMMLILILILCHRVTVFCLKEMSSM